MDYFPVFAKISDRRCLVVGGGAVAERKIHMLRKAQAGVTVISPDLSPSLRELHLAGDLVWIERRFRPADISEFDLIIAATSDEAVNQEVSRVARRERRLVNVVDAPALSNFISPAIVDRTPLVVAISSSGAMPVLARRVRAWLESLLPANLGDIAHRANRWRERVKTRFPDLDQRRRFWDATLDRILAAGGWSDRKLQDALQQEKDAPEGRVFLVGAGPGDPDLLTLKALQVMQQADVIVHDRLVSPGILERARRDAEFINVGKTPGSHRFTQARINRLIVELASEGKVVCRLKGGDPALFARASEELAALRGAGIEVTIVPGITAASGCAAAAGIPLTDRDLAHGLTLSTAHCKDGMDCMDFESLVEANRTLAFYMPVKHLDVLQQKLISHGLSQSASCAIVENGTRDDQRILRASLGQLARTAARASVKAPAMLLVGDVVDQIPASAVDDQPPIAARSAA